MTERLEDPIHIAIYDYLSWSLPSGWLVQHTANKPRSITQGAREKRMGAIRGWPDLQILGPRRPSDPSGWFVEVKAPGKSVPPYQRDLHDRMADAGAVVAVCRSIEDARAAVAMWRLPSLDSAIAGVAA